MTRIRRDGRLLSGGAVLALLLFTAGSSFASSAYPDTVYPISALRLRAAPSINAQILTTIPSGTHVGADLDRYEESDGITWVPARFQGLEGWVAAEYLSTEPPRNAVPSSWRPASKATSDDGGKTIALGLIFYMLPTLIALARRHHNLLAICFLDLLAGWTGIGWFIAFIWSLTAVRRSAPA